MKKFNELPKGTYYVSKDGYSGLSKIENMRGNRLGDIMRVKSLQKK